MELSDSSLGVKKTTPVTSFSKRLLLVGRGPWSAKIASAVTRENPGIQFEVISARSLLMNANLIKESAFQYIWLCVRPNLQSRLLNHLSKLESIFILEKPFALSENGFQEIRESKAFADGRVRQSRVWRYSPVWQHFLTNSPKEITKIEISRGGPLRTSVLPLPEDWISHDLYLLTDLLGKDVLSLEVEEATCKEEKFECIISISSASILVQMSIGNFSERRADWTVHGREKISKIDFLASTFQESQNRETIRIEGNDAISSMLNDFEILDKERLILDWTLQKLFITKVLADAR